jgi:hypothetical protein
MIRVGRAAAPVSAVTDSARAALKRRVQALVKHLLDEK